MSYIKCNSKTTPVENTLAELGRLKQKPGRTFSKNVEEKARSFSTICPNC